MESWNDLPMDVITQVLEFSGPCDKANARLVCQTWKAAADRAVKEVTPRYYYRKLDCLKVSLSVSPELSAQHKATTKIVFCTTGLQTSPGCFLACPRWRQ